MNSKANCKNEIYRFDPLALSPDREWLLVAQFAHFGEAYLAAGMLSQRWRRAHKVVDARGKTYSLPVRDLA